MTNRVLQRSVRRRLLRRVAKDFLGVLAIIGAIGVLAAVIVFCVGWLGGHHPMTLFVMAAVLIVALVVCAIVTLVREVRDYFRIARRDCENEARWDARMSDISTSRGRR
jgi:hypothetical protein